MSGPLNQLDKQAHDEFCCTLAALILFDEGIDISADKLNKVIQASGNKIDAYWAPLFAKAIAGKNIADLLTAGAPAGGAQVAATEAPKQEAKKAEKKEEKKEEEAADVGAMDLFGGDDDW